MVVYLLVAMKLFQPREGKIVAHYWSDNNKTKSTSSYFSFKISLSESFLEKRVHVKKFLSKAQNICEWVKKRRLKVMCNVLPSIIIGIRFQRHYVSNSAYFLFDLYLNKLKVFLYNSRQIHD